VTSHTLGSVALAVLLALAGCSSGAPSGSPASSSQANTLSPKEAVAKAALLLDVRTSEEFASGHLEGAENIPVDQVDSKVDAIASKLGGDKTKSVVVYCASGGRAGTAKGKLEKAGFTNVMNAGGYKDLKP